MAVCMFTGHRPKGLPFGYNERDSRCKKLKKALKKLILSKMQNENVTTFLSGMASVRTCLPLRSSWNSKESIAI